MEEGASPKLQSEARGRSTPGDIGHSVSQRLTDLQALNSRDLRAEWRSLFGSNPPSLSRDLLIRALAYRVQELAYGGLSKAIARSLAAPLEGRTSDELVRSIPAPRLKPGARLVREWHGRTHVVTVTEEGFAYEGKTYASLTSIARQITGGHWSGPRFFGLSKTRSSRTVQKVVSGAAHRLRRPTRGGERI